MESANRWADSRPLASSSFSTASICSGDSAWGPSLRMSSTRECSRAARYLSARPLSDKVGRPAFEEDEGNGLGDRGWASTKASVTSDLLFSGMAGGTLCARWQQGDVQRLADLVFDLAGQFRVLAQEFA